jgi:hypothetical protein
MKSVYSTHENRRPLYPTYVRQFGETVRVVLAERITARWTAPSAGRSRDDKDAA